MPAAAMTKAKATKAENTAPLAARNAAIAPKKASSKKIATSGKRSPTNPKKGQGKSRWIDYIDSKTVIPKPCPSEDHLAQRDVSGRRPWSILAGSARRGTGHAPPFGSPPYPMAICRAEGLDHARAIAISSMGTDRGSARTIHRTGISAQKEQRLQLMLPRPVPTFRAASIPMRGPRNITH